MRAGAQDTDAGAPPLGLYVHLPWCLRKCPYCDFNSHAISAEPPFESYLGRLLADLDAELEDPAARRPLESVFIGGGTPSLLPGPLVARLLQGVSARTELSGDAEVTLEANPGAVDAAHFAAYREAGVNRLSIGAQSLSASQLARLGRIHDPEAVRAAVSAARSAGFDNLNLDLMFALPVQSLAEARDDLLGILSLAPEHVSYYQLTLEPNTALRARPPALPDADLAADMAAQGRETLEAAGYRQYEVSAFGRPGRECRHNLGYWRFGDYLGIGAGAHGKLTDLVSGRVRRRAKARHPDAYLRADSGASGYSERVPGDADLVFEFALNLFRLTDGFEIGLFSTRTGLPWSRLESRLRTAAADGLVVIGPDRVTPTDLGRRFADELVMCCLDEPSR